MLKELNKLFVETLKLDPEMWLYILLAVVGVAFLVTLIVGLLIGDFVKIKGLMAKTAATPSNAVAYMKQMPSSVKRQYKHARLANVKPSDLVTENECVDVPYKHSLLSKVWIVTFVTTVICAGIGYAMGGIGLTKVNDEGVDAAALTNAPYILPALLLIVGGLLTLIGAIVSKLSRSSAAKKYADFAAAIDGELNGGAARNAQPRATEQRGGFAYGGNAEQGVTVDGYQAADRSEPDAQSGNAEPVREYGAAVADSAESPAQPVYAQYDQASDDMSKTVYEPVATPVVEPVATPVVAQESEEELDPIERDIRNREEAIARMHAEQEAAQAKIRAEQEAAQARAIAEQEAQAQAQAAAAQAAAEAQAAAAAQAQAQAQAQAAAQAKAQAQAAAQAQAVAQAQAQAAQAAQAQATSSADDVIARIEKIDREGAPRETMREVATLLQRERAKPENKTPEQQKRLNEALSKLLKAMSAANKK